MNFEILVFRISRISFIVYRFSWVLIRFYGFPFVVGRVLTVIELTFCNPHKKIPDDDDKYKRSYVVYKVCN